MSRQTNTQKTYICLTFKEMIHPKKMILSPITHPHVIPNL